MNKVKIKLKPKKTGKTTSLLSMFISNGGLLVVPNEANRMDIIKRGHICPCEAEYIMSVDKFCNIFLGCGAPTVTNLYIDEYMFYAGKHIKAIGEILATNFSNTNIYIESTSPYPVSCLKYLRDLIKSDLSEEEFTEITKMFTDEYKTLLASLVTYPDAEVEIIEIHKRTI